jgi:hypothetical protein
MVIIRENGLDKLNILLKHFGDVVDGADVGDRSHQAASE